MLALWMNLALAAAPDKVAAEVDLSAGTLDGVVTSEDGRLAVAVGDGGVHVLDTEDWRTGEATPCDVESAAVEAYSADLYYLYLGCSTGSVHAWTWTEGRLEAATDADGLEVTWDLDAEAGSPVVGAWWDGGGLLLYAAVKSGTGLVLHTIDPESGEVDGGAFPLTLLQPGFIEGGLSGNTLFVAHGGDDVTQLALGTSIPTVNPLPDPFSITDTAPSLGASFYGVASNGVVVEYLFATNAFVPLVTGLEDPSAVAASLASDDPWLLVATASELRAYDVSGGGELLASAALEGGALDDLAVGRFGYAFGVGGGGQVSVLTANPWVSGVTTTPGTHTSGDRVTVDFEVDEPGSYQIRLGGTAAGDGELTSEGNVTAGSASVELEVGATWPEGRATVYVFVTDGEGQIGHGVGEIEVDNPPAAPELAPSSLRVGDGYLTLAFEGLPDEDLARYEVYVTTEPFEGSTYPTAGPEYVGPDDLASPLVFSYEGGSPFSEDIAPLTNDLRYYVAVRAVDAGGKESPMSTVIEGVPQPTYSASQLAGDRGGAPCDTGRAPLGLGLLGLATLGIALRRRAALASAVLLGLVTGPDAAWAQDASATEDAEKGIGWRRDATPAWGNVELRYGQLELEDDRLDAYESATPEILQLEVGLQAYRVFELDVGIGRYRDVATTATAEGDASAETSTFTLLPLSLSATARLHVLDEQVLVPHARIGLDYALWNEAWEDGAEAEVSKRSGAKAGWHYGFGAALLLDTFSRGRASYLEAQTGINDTWLVFEWRRQEIEPGDFLVFENSRGLAFSGAMWSLGLKLDF